MSIRGYLAGILNRSDVNLPDDIVMTIMERYKLDPWFFEGVFKKRTEFYWNAWKSSHWLAKRLHRNSHIYETGCGPALNLIWFGQNGFRHLYGSDIDPNVLAAARELCEAAGINVTLWIDNGIKPTSIPLIPFDAVLALNWTYLVESFELDKFLNTYRNFLKPGGYIVIDVIDSSYNQVPNNQYLTGDWDKPVKQRRPSEYKNRYSMQQVVDSINAIGLELIESIPKSESNFKKVYIIENKQNRLRKKF